MTDNGEGSSLLPSRSVPISTSSVRSTSPAPESRQASIARLASPVPSASLGTSFPSRQGVPAGRPISIAASNVDQNFRAVDNMASLPGPGQSMIASQLQESLGRSVPRFGTPSRITESPSIAPTLDSRPVASEYGSFDVNNNNNYGPDANGAGAYEDPEVVRRHLVLPQNASESRETGSELGTSHGDEEFSSLQLQGGDITRQVYRWAEDADSARFARSKSFSISRPAPEAEIEDIHTIQVPGGFRRDFLRRTAGSPHRGGVHGSNAGAAPAQPQLPTSSFLEFLTLYGHFAGEELEEDDEVLGPGEYFSSDTWEPDEAREAGEDAALLRGDADRKKRKHKQRAPPGNTTTTGAVMLLLKSFVGTGILFLPRAFLNGGMLFSSMVLLGVSILSYYAFILLVNTRMKIEGSFGDIGGILFGKHMRRIILGSIVLSQLGFVSAYIVFVSQNLQAFVLAVSKCKSFIDIKYLVLLQLVIFLPLSLIRDIGKLGFTALIADAFILLGLLYIYYYDARTLIGNGGVSDIKAFNPATWSMFIGTAIFTYEGIGLIIPIQESMKQPRRFPGVLAGVMVVITLIFLSAGGLSYAAYGSATKTVILLNLPQDDKFVNVVQLLYSLAILLSTPLQLFPAIRILENELFTRSGKYNPYIKWKKNAFRFFLVFVCAFVAWGGASDLDKFVALVGSFACVPLIYVYPPLLHLRACAQSRRQAIADIALAVLGVICCIYTTALTLQNWFNAGAPESPGYCDSK